MTQDQVFVPKTRSELGLPAFDPTQEDLAGSSVSSEVMKELEEVQKQFETYRTEMGVDSSRLREESLSAQREVSKLNAALAKANAQVEVLTGRFFTTTLEALS